jgi:hypothetical protein
MAEPAVAGVRINGGKVHVFRPGIRPITRCGLRAGRAQKVEDDIDTTELSPEEKCAKCFPGSGRRGDKV